MTPDGTLRAAGSAQRAFIDRARLIAPALPGVAQYDDSALRSEEALAALRASTAALQAIELPFARGSAVTFARGALRNASNHARALISAASQAQFGVCVAVEGYTDPLGTPAQNARLRALRAEHVTRALRAQGVPGASLRAVSGGLRPGAQGEASARSVTFRVHAGASCTDET
jgi:outer membrane protein OmpA-like peptidoglycan-associated protein